MEDKNDQDRTSRDRGVARRRRQILEAALTCFLENGYHQTGVRDIARKAGVSLGNLYNHFPGKHDVLVEIAVMEREELAPILKSLAAKGPAARVLDRFVTSYARYLASPENVILSIEIASEAVRQADIADLFLENRDMLIRALRTVLERGVAEGSMRQLPDPQEAAQMIVEVIEGSAYRCTLNGVPMRNALSSLQDFIAAAVAIR